MSFPYISRTDSVIVGGTSTDLIEAVSSFATMLSLANDSVQLCIDPLRGGGVVTFSVAGQDVFRAASAGSDPLTLANFPLVPFANRIAFQSGRLSLAPNRPVIDSRNAIHGYSWLSEWTVQDAAPGEAEIGHVYNGPEWPWAYQARQHFALVDDGYVHEIAVTNLSERAMPAGLGLHPYFMRPGARLDLAVTGLWHTDAGDLPTHWEALDTQPDWFNTEPLDNCFTSRAQPITIAWPTMRLSILPDPALAFTHIYIPAEADYFCVEPVSHMPNAVNRDEDAQVTGLRWLDPGESWSARTMFHVTVTA